MTRYLLPLDTTAAQDGMGAVQILKAGVIIAVGFQVAMSGTPQAGALGTTTLAVRVNLTAPGLTSGTAVSQSVVATAIASCSTTATDVYRSPTNCIIPANYPVPTGSIVQLDGIVDSEIGAPRISGMVWIDVRD